MRRKVILMAVATTAVALSLTACSSGSSESSAASPAASAGGDVAGTDEMRALCDQMVADGMTPEDATALAESNGFTARVGTINGQPQAVTMDYREDRFTFDVESGAVVACTYG